MRFALPSPGTGFAAWGRKATATLAGAALIAACATSCSKGISSTDVASPSPSGQDISSLATTVATSDGTWATVAMGQLSQPLNTFWQLLFRPTGATSWTDQVKATAVATNGGLVLASSQGKSLIVGVRPTNLLTFSPLIDTFDGGHTWTNGLLPYGLGAYPSALAAGPSGRSLALTDAPTSAAGQSVLDSEHLSSWQTLVSRRDLAASGAGQACSVAALTAVAFEGKVPAIGARCVHSGVVGLWAPSHGSWRLVGPALPESLRAGSVSVMALEPTSEGLSCLLTVTGPFGSRVLAAWSGDSGQTWRLSQPIRLSASEAVRSIGSVGTSGLFVLLADSSGPARAEVVSGQAAPWTALPTPPIGTETLAFGPGTTVEALAVSAAVLTVWSLGPNSSGWHKGQVMQVPIDYGSSS